MADVDSVSEALKAISVSTDLVEEELKPHLDTVLAGLLEKKKDAAIEIAKSGILPSLAQVLLRKSSLSCQVALVVAEMAREAAVRESCIEAGLVKALVPHLDSNNEEMLLNTGRAIGRICFDNAYQQDQLVQSGVIARLVSIMREYPKNDPLVNVCLLALCNLADMDCAREALADLDVSEVLILQLRRAPDAERRHVILEILGSLGESDALKLQFAESGVPEALSEMIRSLQGGDDPHDFCSMKIASNLIVSLLLGAINKVRMLEDGVTERIKSLLRTDMPPVQFKLLGTLRMMVDGQEEAALMLGGDAVLLARIIEWCEAKDHVGVRGEASRLLAALIRHSRNPEVVRAVAKEGGIQQLISMATSEHVIMQNEALVALAIASALDIESVKDPLRDAELLPELKKILEDPAAAVEVKFSTLGLICTLANCSLTRDELISVNMKESLSKLTDHSSSKLASQASSILNLL
ncbi:rap1 GTPase-GDP dissociation stimulator 1-like isoform X4 [Oryzias latipes]|uniref:rap1 GTPase-GDP dissociation stimulator 1-like isoform X4 n=1 Tax=Oryzias latipes TaxID=8090 RepID=UPI0005CC850F|nr:rap1 GTPase-GDP dissociation stimulator 1-like isoform X4 [Oryzias latipes]